MLITKEIKAHIGHRVPNHKSKCKNLHGHTYRIECGIDDRLITKEGVSNEGMVMDFSDLKQIMVEHIYDEFDHGFIMYSKDEFYDIFLKLKVVKGQKIIFVDFIPTAENLAKYWYRILLLALELKDVKIHHVKVWETPSSTAIFTVEDIE